MIENIDKGNTLIVKGPARVTLLEGKLDVFGKLVLPEKESSTSDISNIEDENVLIIPSAQCYPLYAHEDVKLEIYTSNEENLKLVKKNSVSLIWVNIKNEILDAIGNMLIPDDLIIDEYENLDDNMTSEYPDK